MSVVLSDDGGSVAVSAGALSQLVVQAAESVEGVRVRRARRHLEITVAVGRARVELELAARYGVVLPEAARAVQERVAEALQTMCEVRVDVVNVAIEELD